MGERLCEVGRQTEKRVPVLGPLEDRVRRTVGHFVGHSVPGISRCKVATIVACVTGIAISPVKIPATTTTILVGALVEVEGALAVRPARQGVGLSRPPKRQLHRLHIRLWYVLCVTGGAAERE